MPTFKTLLALTSLAIGGTLAPVTPAHATEPTADHTIRMTADTVPVTDSAGHVWAPRTTDLATDKRSTRLLGKAVSGTSEPRLYQVNAWGAPSWSIPVPSSGRYRVRLLMAEDSFTAAGKRVFDVTAEGQTVASAVDIFAAVGFGAADDVSFDAHVVDGRLDLGFVRRVDQPLVAAVEVTPLPPEASADGHVRMVAGGAPVRDASGATWSPAFGYTGPHRTSTALAGAAIGGTDDDELYRTATWGMTGWSVPAPRPGRYTVRLLTTEGRWTGVGQRVFDVGAEGEPALTGVDIFHAAGVRTAYAPQFTVDVTDGTLDLTFTARADQATISAIEVVPPADPTLDPSPTPAPTPAPTPETSSPSGAAADGGAPEPTPSTSPSTSPSEGAGADVFTSRMVARPRPLVDAQGRTWSRWSATLGSWRTSNKLTGDITGTDDDELYRANVWGVKGYALRVPGAATYHVRLLMAEDSFFSAGKRVFDVRAEGRPAAENVDIAGAAGHGGAHDVVFDVPVTDGQLDLSFVAKVDQPLVSAIEVTSTTPVPAADDAPHRIVTLAPDSFYTMPITDAPLAADSDAVSAYVARQVTSRYGGMAAFNAYHYNIAFFSVPKGQRRVTVDYACGPTPPPGLYDGSGQFLDVPVPDAAVTSKGTDGAMSIYDAAADQLWNFWQMTRNPVTGRWSACWGGRIDHVSRDQGRFPSGYGASASGIAVAPGIVTLQDVVRGRIDHAIAISLPGPAAGRFSWPANRTDGTSSDPAAVMEGQRLRLDPTLDLDAYDLTPIGRMVAEAAQKYGFVVTDNGGAVAITTESGEPYAAVSGVNSWDALVDGRDWEVMRGFPWAKMQALPKDYGAPVS